MERTAAEEAAVMVGRRILWRWEWGGLVMVEEATAGGSSGGGGGVGMDCVISVNNLGGT